MKKITRTVLKHVPRKYIHRVVHIGMPLLGLFYTGRGRQCPVCGRQYRKFLPYGYVRVRENAMCPNCMALERHRLMWLWLEREASFFEDAPRLLHFAPEKCFIKRFRRALGEGYVTADLESPLADVKCDIQAIPFADNEFEVVFCNHVLEHIPDDRLAMREMWRVMKPGGWGIMMVPVNPARDTTYEDPSITTGESRAAAFGQYDHLREYGRDYPGRLRETGFEVEELDYIRHLSEGEISRYALAAEILYIVRKP